MNKYYCLLCDKELKVTRHWEKTDITEKKTTVIYYVELACPDYDPKAQVPPFHSHMTAEEHRIEVDNE